MNKSAKVTFNANSIMFFIFTFFVLTVWYHPVGMKFIYLKSLDIFFIKNIDFNHYIFQFKFFYVLILVCISVLLGKKYYRTIGFGTCCLIFIMNTISILSIFKPVQPVIISILQFIMIFTISFLIAFTIKEKEKTTAEADLIHALPKNCSHDLPLKGLLQLALFDELKENMTDEEIIAGHNEEQPFLDKMREITCRKCNHPTCPYGFKQRKSSGLQDLKIGLYPDRIEKGDQLIAELFSDEKKKHLAEKNIALSAWHMPSRKNPQIFISLKKGEKTFRIFCEVGKQLLEFQGEEESLFSLNQIKEKIELAITNLAA